MAKVNGGTLYVNAGLDSGLAPGDVLIIYRVVDQVTDPVTGEILGLETAVLGQATITQVRSRYATARFAAASPPQVGDVLRLSGGPGGQLSQVN